MGHLVFPSISALIVPVISDLLTFPGSKHGWAQSFWLLL